MFQTPTVLDECYGTGDNAAVFLHANGYPPGTYQALFEQLSDTTIQCPLLPCFWQPAPAPELCSWSSFAADLAPYFSHRDVELGIGHSIGGTLWLFLAFYYNIMPKKLVLIDPAIFSQFVYYGYRFATYLGMQKKVHPLIEKALKRKTSFPSHDDMFKQYRGKKIFNHVSDRVLRDYIHSITLENTAGVQLNFDVQWEANIYETGVLHDTFLWENMPTLTSDVLLIRGTHSDVVSKSVEKRFKRLVPSCKTVTLPDASHIVPLEYPDLVAQEIKLFLS